MEQRRFFLHGIGGVYNYGCEAIVRGTVEILRNVWPECEIVYMSRRPAEDRKALDGCFISIIDNRLPSRSYPWRILKGILRRAGLPHTWISLDKLPNFRLGDCLLSIGGDIFTLGPGPYPRKVGLDKLAFVRKVLSKGCLFILWGASVGPFEDWPEAVPVFQKHFAKMTLITVREPETKTCLESLGISDNVVDVADPAFLLPAEDVVGDFPFDKDDRLVVAVNLSLLSVRHTIGLDKSHEVLRSQTDFIRALIDNLKVRIILVPHVVAPHHPPDDDYSYLKEIMRELSKPHSNMVALLPPDLGARRTKGAISKCDALLAARMHCGIAGVSSSTPTIFIAYSQKAWGMCEFIYGNCRWCVSLEDFHARKMIDLVSDLLQQRGQIRKQLEEYNKKFREMALSAGPVLRDFLNSK